MHLLKQVAEPQPYSSIAPWSYNPCPICSKPKNKKAKLCRKCRTKSNRPPVISKVFMRKGKRCRKMPLAGGHYALINEVKYEWAMQWHWHIKRSKNKLYAVRAEAIGPYRGWHTGKRKQKTIYLHHAILGIEPPEQGDHRNGDTLDNRVENLRKCNQSQNCRNRKISTRNRSGYIGVSFDRKMRKWRACIWLTNHNKHLGFYDSAIEAAKVRDKASVRYYRSFAKLNFPYQGKRS